MATRQQKAFCVLEFAKSESIIRVQREFRRRYGANPPSDNNIRRWYRQFCDTGCLCKGKSPGRPRVSDENTERIRETFACSPRKSLRRASRELQMPHQTIWKVVRRRLLMKAYKIHMLQALQPNDKIARMNFCNFFQESIDNNESFSSRLIFSDEATFHISGKVNRHNVRIWGTQHPHEIHEQVRDSPKVNVFCAISQHKVYGPFFFDGLTVNGDRYLEMLQTWLFPKFEEQGNFDNLIFQQDGAPPHWSLQVREFLNDFFPHRWIGRSSADDLVLHPWPPRSPDMTPCDFFLWGYIKDTVFVPPLANNLVELKARIEAAVASVTPDMLSRVWDELCYRVDVIKVCGGGHIEHL